MTYSTSFSSPAHMQICSFLLHMGYNRIADSDLSVPDSVKISQKTSLINDWYYLKYYGLYSDTVSYSSD